MSRSKQIDTAKEKNKPKFSVVIATYNRRDYILETIQSVKEQIHPAYEIIVVVDGSTDDTAKVVRELFSGVVVYEQRNLGRCIARNTGIALATGDWVCFLDDDDLWHRDKLKNTAEYIEAHPDCQAVNNPSWFFADRKDGPDSCFGFRRDFVAKNLKECHEAVASGNILGNDFEYLNIHGNSFRLLLERNRGALSSSVVQREILIRAGGFCPMQAKGEEWTMFLNIARLCEWHTIPQRLTFARLHERQDTLICGMGGGLTILAGQINAWYTGRPMPHKTGGLEMLGEMVKYGPVYRQAIQGYHWNALRRGEFRLAKLIRLAGRLLLPRLCDYLYIFIPPQITWWWETYILKRHK